MPDFESVKSLDLTGKYVVVGGGPAGVGAGVAVLCARLGATVAILGRSKGEEIVARMTEEGKAKGAAHAFIKADLSSIAGAKAAVADIEKWLGDNHIDILFESQGSPPANISSNSDDGLEKTFQITVLSRFILAYLLLNSGALKLNGTIASTLAAGHGASTIDVNNLDGRGTGFFARMGNNAAVMDCMVKEFAIKYPTLRVTHTFPGLVTTGALTPPTNPWWFNTMIRLITWVPGMTRTPDEYALVALWIAASPEAVANKEVWSYGDSGQAVPPCKPSEDPVIRGQVWSQLLAMAKIAP